jgi:hypothetical protein
LSAYSTAAPRGRRYLVIGATLVVAAAALIAVMNRTNASAATASEVALHCRDGSPLLEKCDFIQRSATTKDGNSFRVSEPQNNCDGTEPDEFGLAVSVRSSVEALVDTNNFFRLSGSLSFPDVFDFTATTARERFNTLGFRDEVATTVTISAEVEPGTRAAIYFRPEVVEFAGFLEGTYKEATDGTKVFFFPERNADTVLLRFPLANDGGDPKGFYWIRSVKCTNDGPGVSRLQIPNFDTAGFGELAGFGVSDTPITVG